MVVAANYIGNGRFLRAPAPHAIKLQKGVDRSRPRTYMAAHRGGAAGFPAPIASVANPERTAESPGANRGTSGVRSVVLDGSLTSSILMKGHVGDGARSGELKAPVTGLYKPTPHPAQTPRLRWVMHVHSYPLRLTVQVSAP